MLANNKFLANWFYCCFSSSCGSGSRGFCCGGGSCGFCCGRSSCGCCSYDDYTRN